MEALEGSVVAAGECCAAGAQARGPGHPRGGAAPSSGRRRRRPLRALSRGAGGSDRAAAPALPLGKPAPEKEGATLRDAGRERGPDSGGPG